MNNTAATLPALLATLAITLLAHGLEAMDKKEYTGNHGNKVIVHYDPTHCIVKEDTIYVIHRATSITLEMIPADDDWEYDEGNSTLKPGEHPADPSTVTGEEDLFNSEFAFFKEKGSNTDQVTIHVVLVNVTAKIELPNGQKYCDGIINIPVNVIIEPEWLKDHTGSVELEFKSPEECDNPAGMCSQLAMIDEIGFEWEIDNARWFSNRDDHCNMGSTYEFTGNCKIHGADVEVKKNPLLFVTVYGCINGCAQIMKMWNGDPHPTIKYDEIIKKWIVEDISINDFKRDVKADWDYMGTEHSQYKQMVIFEEVYHAYAQMENTAHWFYGQYLNAQNVYNELLSYSQNITADDKDQLFKDLVDEFYDLLDKEEEKLSFAKTNSVTCDLEKEAKHATNQTHYGTYYCTYVLHGQCSN